MTDKKRDPEKQREYVRRHQTEKCDQITIRPKKGTKDRWRAAAEAEGLSLQQFIISAVEAAVAARKAEKDPEA